jgi:hypothetical protein
VRQKTGERESERSECLDHDIGSSATHDARLSKLARIARLPSRSLAYGL